MSYFSYTASSKERQLHIRKKNLRTLKPIYQRYRKAFTVDEQNKYDRIFDLDYLPDFVEPIGFLLQTTAYHNTHNTRMTPFAHPYDEYQIVNVRLNNKNQLRVPLHITKHYIDWNRASFKQGIVRSREENEPVGKWYTIQVLLPHTVKDDTIEGVSFFTEIYFAPHRTGKITIPQYVVDAYNYRDKDRFIVFIHRGKDPHFDKIRRYDQEANPYKEYADPEDEVIEYEWF